MSNNRYLIFEARNGLGNRLRALYSSYHLAQYLNRQLLVLWGGFNKYWTANEIEFITRDDPRLKDAKDCYFGLDFSNTKFLSTYDKLKADRSEVVHISTGQMFKSPAASMRQYNLEKSKFYNKLVLASPLANVVDRFSQEYFSGHRVLGLQVRQGDRSHFHDDIDLVFNYVTQFVADFDRVYFTSDDQGLLDLAKSRLPIQCVSTAQDRNDQTSDEIWKGVSGEVQQRKDIIDFYLLGKCTFILYSHRSTYGYEAAFFNNVGNFPLPVSTHVAFPFV